MTESASKPGGDPSSEIGSASESPLPSSAGEISPPVSSENYPEFSERFEVLGHLGAGGMGDVYKAFDKENDQIVALKLVHSELTEGSFSLKRFHREVAAMASMEHSGLVKILGHDVAVDGRQFLLMEYVEGYDLSDLLRKEGRLEESRAVDIFIQTFSALQYVHSKKIIHRDLKPSNILLESHGSGEERVKIVDFGIAKFINTEALNATAITRTGDIFGSPSYMSPEQCQGEVVDEASDVYSMGCLMYECLTGEPPFDDESPVNVVLQHLHDEPKSLNLFDAELKVSDSLETIVLNCLVKDRKKRYSKANDVLKDLLRLRDGKSLKKRRVDSSSTSVKVAKSLLFYTVLISSILAVILSVILIRDYSWLVNLSKVSQLSKKEESEKLRIGKELVRVADSHNKPFAQLILAEIYYEQGKLELANSLIEESLAVFRSRHDNSQNIEPFLRLLIAIELDRKDLVAANKHYQTVLTLAKSKKRNRKGVKSIGIFKGFYLPAPIVSACDVMNDYADALYSRGFYSVANTIYTDMADYAKTNSLILEQFQAIRKRANLLTTMGEGAKAENLRARCIEIVNSSALKNEYQPLRDLGDDYLVDRHFERANELFRKLNDLHKSKADNDRSLIIDNLRLAYSYSLLGKKAVAEEIYARLYKENISNPDTYEGRRVLRSYANFNIRKGDYKRAEKILLELLAVYERNNNYMRTATISIRIANCLALQGKVKEARALSKTAQDSFAKVEFSNLQKDKLFYTAEFLKECSVVARLTNNPKKSDELKNESQSLIDDLSPNTYRNYLARNQKSHIIDSDYFLMELMVVPNG